MFLRTKHSPLFVALLLFLAASTLAAQSYPVASITFSGTPAYSSSELLAASGLTVGAKLEQAGMQAGAQRLDSTGMFSTVRFNFNGKELHYEMTPATTLVPVRYVNSHGGMPGRSPTEWRRWCRGFMARQPRRAGPSRRSSAR